MPDSRMRKGSMADMMAKVPVNKGSLLAGLENLLKTIESSESTVMIPTLLRDKCEFDAWELLFVAKILKASILGHSDLVEFYVNHISHQKSLLAASQAASSTNGPPATALRQPSSPALSPAMSHRNGLSSNSSSQAPGQQQTLNGHQHQSSGAPLSLSSASSVSSQASTTTATAGAGQSAPTQTGSWTTLPASQHLQPQQHSNQQQQQQQQPQPQLGGRSNSSSLSSCSSQSSSAPQPAAAAAVAADSGNVTAADIELALLASRAAATAAPSVATRTPQPPSLLQLTTTNNHINSMVNLTASGAIEQLAGSTLQLLASGQPSSELGFGSDFGSGALSISTASGANQQQPGSGAGATVATTPNSASQPGEFRSSRSAGCLFRNSNTNNNSQSGASSPRAPLTPTTPTWPQAETLANGGTQLPGDPSVPVKLLLQIEQLKTSIAYVAGLLESVVELYKKSIDNIAS